MKVPHTFRFAVLLCYFQVQFTYILIVQGNDGSMDSNNFDGFTYPDYCSKTPLDPSLRQSPPLDLHHQLQDLKLVQLHLFFRHGARTPSAYAPCWMGYNPHWDCQYDEAGLGTLHPHTSELGSTFTFRRVFDADPYNNVFGGTCQKGQLISEGAMQHREIGKYLASSYLIPNNERKIPTEGSPAFINPSEDLTTSVYLRSTDMQRTRLSASNLLTSALESAFPNDKKKLVQSHLPILHTMDLEQDDMAINPARCPRLTEIADEVFKSDGFKAMAKENEELLQKLENATGREIANTVWPDQMMDCLMSHICADRWENIPDGLNPNGSNPTASRQLISDTIKAIDREMAYLYLYKNSSYSRLGMSHFMLNLRSRIHKLIDNDTTADGSSNHLAKLYLWSGHDTTIMPLLASFGPNVWNSKWPPYASIVVLEVFEDRHHNLLFRLIFNGHVVTNGIDGCNDALCNVTNLNSAMSWVDQASADCERSIEGSETALSSRIISTRPPWPKRREQELKDSTGVSFSYQGLLVSFYIGLGTVTGVIAATLFRCSFRKLRAEENNGLARPLLN